METDKNLMNEKILNLTLEIIFLLTGEDYTVVKKTSGKYVTPRSCPCMSKGRGRSQSPIMDPPAQSLIYEKNNEQKILDLTNKILELLNGEVPIRCQDIVVYFSMEEWEYLEGHKDLYDDVIMEDHRPLTSPVGFGNEDENEDLKTSASLSYVKHKDRDINGNVQGTAEELNSFSMEEVATTTRTQYPSINIEEKPPCDRGNLTKSNIYHPVDHTMCLSPNFLKEPVSCDGRNSTDHTQQCQSSLIKEEPSSSDEDLTDPNRYTTADHTQYLFPNIKEEPVSSGGNLIDLNIYTPTDHTQQYPTTRIKEESSSCDGDRTDPKSYAPTDHTQYPFPNIKEEPVSSGGNLIDLNIYTPTDHTQHQSSHFKEEPVSCDGGNLIDPDTYTPTDHTQPYPATHIKEEQVSCDEGLTDTNSYTPTDHTQYLFPYIKKEPVSSNLSLTDVAAHALTDSTQQYRSSHIRNKPDSYDGENLTNPDCTIPTDHTQYVSKEEPMLEKASSLQKHESSSSGKLDRKDVSKKRNEEPEPNYNDITISSKKYFCTIQQTTHSLEILYNCPECPECFTSNLDLAKHQIIHTGGMPFICSVCGRCFGRKSDLVIHQVTHGGSNDFGCPHCNLFFATKSSLSIHEKTHVQKKPMPCPECGKTFPTKKRLTRHRQIHTDERPFKCPECGDTFKRKAHLQRHQTIHEKARQQLICNQCGDLFRSEVELSAHETVHEKKKDSKCSEGGGHLIDRLELLKHQVKHSRPKPFQSSGYKRFHNSKPAFQVNHRLHTFQCLECSKSFNSKSSLQMHQKIHVSGQSMAAPELRVDLSKDSISSPHLESFKDHLTLTSSECGNHSTDAQRKKKPPHKSLKSLPCPVCEKSFCSKYKLNRHYTIHTREKPLRRSLATGSNSLGHPGEVIET